MWEAIVDALPIVGGTAGLLAWWQTRRSTDRSAWWDRTRWCVDLALSGQELEQKVGVAGLAVIARSGMTKRIDRKYFDTLYDHVAVHVEPARADSSQEMRDNDGQRGAASDE